MIRAACFVGAFLTLILNDAAYSQVKQNSDYCKPSGRVFIFLLDVTTAYDQADKDAIVRLTDDLLLSSQGGDKLIVRTISDSHTHSERMIERCIPFCKEEGMYGRLMHCSDGRIRTDAKSVQGDVVGSLRKKLSKFESLDFSDIVRTIHSVSMEDIPQDGSRAVVVIYSDLIENSNYFSSKYLFSYSVSRLLDGLRQYKLIANLKGAEVRVAGVGRAGTADRRPLSVIELNKLNEFWNAYFKESGAQKVVISRD